MIYSTLESYRERIKLASERAEFKVTQYPIGSSSEFIQVSNRSNGRATKVIVHLCGVHGVEGYAGCEAQLRILAELDKNRSKVDEVFITVANPFGMKNNRRVTANNVDLNRNLILPPDCYCGTPENYPTLDRFLNPKGPPYRLELYTLKALGLLTKYSFKEIKQTLGEGQFEYPNGLYFGGKSLEQETQTLIDIFRDLAAKYSEIFVLDLHTGLGDYGEETLIYRDNSTSIEELRSKVHGNFFHEDQDSNFGFLTRGDLQSGIPKLYNSVHFTWIIEEFGTYSAIKMLGALRDEARYSRNGGNDPNHWTRARLRDVFSPRDLSWLERVRTTAIYLYLQIRRVIS